MGELIDAIHLSAQRLLAIGDLFPAVPILLAKGGETLNPARNGTYIQQQHVSFVSETGARIEESRAGPTWGWHRELGAHLIHSPCHWPRLRANQSSLFHLS